MTTFWNHSDSWFLTGAYSLRIFPEVLCQMLFFIPNRSFICWNKLVLVWQLSCSNLVLFCFAKAARLGQLCSLDLFRPILPSLTIKCVTRRFSITSILLLSTDKLCILALNLTKLSLNTFGQVLFDSRFHSFIVVHFLSLDTFGHVLVSFSQRCSEVVQFVSYSNLWTTFSSIIITKSMLSNLCPRTHSGQLFFNFQILSLNLI